MGLFNRRKRHAAWDRGSTREDIKHLEEFTRTRTGVEAYLEPVTMATETTLVLVAHDGEWTRRRVESPEEGSAHDEVGYSALRHPEGRLPPAHARVD